MAFEALALATVAPVLAGDLGGVGLYGWVFSAFLLAQIVGAVAAGRRTDLDGPAKPFLASLVLLGSGLLVGALAPNMLVLILARALQGLGGGALVTCVYAIINVGYPDALRPRMLAAFSSAFVLPALVGPAVAGFVAEQLSWRAVFYGFLPFVVAVGLLAAPAFRRLPKAKGTEPNPSIEPGRLRAAVLLASGTGAMLAGLKMAATGSSPTVLELLLVGAGALVGFYALRKVVPAGTLTARRGLPATIATKGLFAASYFHTEAYLVLALTELSGFRTTTAGLAVSAGAISWTTATWAQERLDRRDEGRGRRTRVLIGASLLTAGIFCLAVVAVVYETMPLTVALAGWTVSGLGMGLANPASTAIAFAHAPKGKEGSVSSSMLLSELFAPAVSIGVGGALVALGFGLGISGTVFALCMAPLLAVLAAGAAFRLPGGSTR